MPIRLRLALLFTAAAIVAAAAGGEVFAAQLRHGLVASLDQGLRAEWTEVARHAAAAGAGRSGSGSGSGHDGQAKSPSTDGVLVGSRGSERASADHVHPTPTMYLSQVLTTSGTVVSESGTPPGTLLADRALRRRAEQGSVSVDATVDGRRLRLLAGPVATDPGRIAVVGASLETLDTTLAEARRLLTVGALALVAASGLAAYFLARAALGPVERMRRHVASLGPPTAGTQLDVPATGDEIARLAETMNGLLDRLGTSLARQRALVADAGHELRTPLTVVLGELELASRPGRSPEELRAGVGRARAEAERLALLAERILLLARSDDGQLRLDARPILLGAVLESVVERHRLQRDDVAIRVVCPEDLELDADGELLTQALDNLLVNALRAAPTGSSVTCSAERDDAGHVVIAVRDAGPGFPPALLPRAFERFARAEPGRSRRTGGAGLGLAIVQAIAVAHGGTAEAANAPDGGALVRLVLPESAAAGQDGARAPVMSPERSQPYAR
jgi:two-component system OmpR family sensor kinase